MIAARSSSENPSPVISVATKPGATANTANCELVVDDLAPIDVDSPPDLERARSRAE